jgi:hypothetical protein
MGEHDRVAVTVKAMLGSIYREKSPAFESLRVSSFCQTCPS